MATFYLDAERSGEAPLFIHEGDCLLKQTEAILLGEFSWASKALSKARKRTPDVERCKYCCPIKPINSKKPRQTRFQQIAEKIRRDQEAAANQAELGWPQPDES